SVGDAVVGFERVGGDGAAGQLDQRVGVSLGGGAGVSFPVVGGGRRGERVQRGAHQGDSFGGESAGDAPGGLAEPQLPEPVPLGLPLVQRVGGQQRQQVLAQPG